VLEHQIQRLIFTSQQRIVYQYRTCREFPSPKNI